MLKNEINLDVIVGISVKERGGKAMKSKKVSRKKIQEVEEMIQNLPVTPQTYAYVKMYQALEELHFQKEYSLICGICDAMLNQ